ncbi:MAG: sulfatase-like hydrolase/transferase [Cryomorphaceae bacterium]|nr:sulfatase-like hydrolase/transferase [Cryomorphaceae bacterium]
MKFLITYYRRILILLALYSTSRIYFYLNNKETIDLHYFLEFIAGLRFDISALVYINIPLFILLFLPHNLRAGKNYHKLTNWLFYVVNIPFLLINNVDIEYIKFTQKRSTADFFQLISLGNDAKNIIPQYLKDYWPITLFSIVQVYLLFKVKEIPNYRFSLNLKSISQQLLVLVLASGLFIISARGGLQLKPINTINAGELCGSQNTSLILNTPFCILHSLDEKPLSTYSYFKKQELENIYSSVHIPKSKAINKKNIVILIMESYSKEFVGHYNEGESYTPFLDSLMEYGMVFNNAYANGLKSIEALPAITASIPTLMDNPFITSNYGQNQFESLASLLNIEGYNTSFFHGGQRGTMGFYSFSRKAGFQEYHGMEEYNNTADFDGSWGIYDIPFMQYFASELNVKKEPFFTTFFSLSSHPPYVLPKDYKHQFEKIEIRETIKYTDDALQKFFKSIQDKKWFKNTLFVITADHTSAVNYNKTYKNRIGRYAIPLLFFKGDGSMVGENNSIVQQIDIMPTILEEIAYTKPYLAFGKSLFSDESWAISKLYSNYHFITDQGIINNKEENYPTFSDWDLKEISSKENPNTKLLKAIKQDYNSRMKNNNLKYEN